MGGDVAELREVAETLQSRKPGPLRRDRRRVLPPAPVPVAPRTAREKGPTVPSQAQSTLEPGNAAEKGEAHNNFLVR